MKRPKITIITVCFNAFNTIKNTILSVLTQTYPNIEYIIVDGGSTDGTLDVIKELANDKVRWISEPDNGIYDAMNKGIRMASGDWIHFRNSGDYFVSKHTIERIFTSEIKGDIAIVHGDCVYINKIGYITYSPPSHSNAYISEMPVFHPCTFVRTDVQKKYMFNLKYKSSADYCLFYTLFSNGYKSLYLPIPVATFTEDGFSSNWKRAYFENADIQERTKTFFGVVKVYIQYYYLITKRYLHDFIFNNIPFVRKAVIQKRIDNNKMRYELPFPYDY